MLKKSSFFRTGGLLRGGGQISASSPKGTERDELPGRETRRVCVWVCVGRPDIVLVGDQYVSVCESSERGRGLSEQVDGAVEQPRGRG